jgi:hypothetical protein
MSIRVTLDDGLPLGKTLPQGKKNRPKIRVTLDPAAPPPLLPAPEAAEASVPQGRLPAPQAAKPFPIPAKVLAFWNYDEDAHRVGRPWQESPAEQSVREQAERDGVWTG